jgi:hypothetical protein
MGAGKGKSKGGSGSGSGFSRATFFIYEDNPVRTNLRPVKYENLDATKYWLRHYDNMLYLQFIDKNEGRDGRPQLTLPEKLRIGHEQKICQQKLDYWARHPNYDQPAALRGAEELKNKWASKPHRKSGA